MFRYIPAMTTRCAAPYRVAFLLIDDYALMSYAAAVEPLRAANRLGGETLYIWENLAPPGGRGLASAGVAAPVRDIGGTGGTGPPPDLALVIAGGDPARFGDAATFRWLRRLAGAGVALGGISGGPVILAAAGVMQGRRLTVHWEHAAALLECAPDLALTRELFVIDRDRMTASGGTAALDLMLALIARRQGPAFAQSVSDWFLHSDMREGGAPQRAGAAGLPGAADPAVLRAVEAMEANLAEPLTLGAVAEAAGRSPRQINRLFQARLGRPAMGWYRDLRLDHARRLLGQSALSVTEIAYAAGFSSGAHFAAAYRRRFGAAPSAARAALRGNP